MSKILKAVHATARGLRKAGTLDLQTQVEFDEQYLPTEARQSVIVRRGRIPNVRCRRRAIAARERRQRA